MGLREELKTFMERTGKSQAEIAREVGVSRSCICRILGGQEDMRAKNYQAILDIVQGDDGEQTQG